MAKQVKGNFTQNPNRLQKEFFIPCEVFRNEKERRESGFPGENCMQVRFFSVWKKSSCWFYQNQHKA